METNLKEKVYEIEFEQLESKEIEQFENKDALLNSKLEISVSLGKCTKSIGDIINLKEGDVISLDKNIDQDLDININDKLIASGETIKIDEKISVRIVDFKNR